VVLKQRINDDLKAALIGGNRFAGEVLRGLKAVILNEEVAQGKRDEGLDDLMIEQLIAREIKKRNESAVIYDNANRPELATSERAEAQILSVYLPKQLSENEINVVIKRVMTETGITANIGQIIGSVKKELGNSADGALVAKLVKNALN
jgi:uncharacterized protein YqeY